MMQFQKVSGCLSSQARTASTSAFGLQPLRIYVVLRLACLDLLEKALLCSGSLLPPDLSTQQMLQPMAVYLEVRKDMEGECNLI